MTGLSVVKVKIYNLDGLTVFSTEPEQIGEDRSQNRGFLAAKAGSIASEIVYKNQFSAFEQQITDRSLVSSYIPISLHPGSPVEGVMEVYSDVTDQVEKLENTSWQIVAGVSGSFFIFYIFLFVIIRRADRIILSQGEQVRAAHRDTILPVLSTTSRHQYQYNYRCRGTHSMEASQTRSGLSRAIYPYR